MEDIFNIPFTVHTVVVFAILALIIYFLKPVLSKFQFFGLKIETTNDFDLRISNDIAVKDCIAVQIEEVDRHCRRSLRNALNGIIRKYIKNFPDMVQVILNARYVLSTAICDNHIAREFAESILEYYQSVQREALNIQPQWVDEQSKEVLTEMVKEWVSSIIADVRESSMKKNTVYCENIKKLKVEINREVCRSKIEKNKIYLEAIRDEDMSSITSILTPRP